MLAEESSKSRKLPKSKMERLQPERINQRMAIACGSKAKVDDENTSRQKIAKSTLRGAIQTSIRHTEFHNADLFVPTLPKLLGENLNTPKRLSNIKKNKISYHLSTQRIVPISAGEATHSQDQGHIDDQNCDKSYNRSETSQILDIIEKGQTKDDMQIKLATLKARESSHKYLLRKEINPYRRLNSSSSATAGITSYRIPNHATNRDEISSKNASPTLYEVLKASRLIKVKAEGPLKANNEFKELHQSTDNKFGGNIVFQGCKTRNSKIIRKVEVNEKHGYETINESDNQHGRDIDGKLNDKPDKSKLSMAVVFKSSKFVSKLHKKIRPIEKVKKRLVKLHINRASESTIVGIYDPPCNLPEDKKLTTLNRRHLQMIAPSFCDKLEDWGFFASETDPEKQKDKCFYFPKNILSELDTKLDYSSLEVKQLLWYIKLPDVKMCSEILKNKPSLVHGVDHIGQTPLHWAVKGNERKLIKLLLQVGANPNKIDLVNTS